MAALPEELRQALEADDAEELNQLLRRRRQEDFDALLTLLTPDPSVPPDHRTKALYALGLWGDPSVVPTITRLLPELDERGRMSALSALGRLGTPDALATIVEHLDEPSPQVRKIAVLALSRNVTPDTRRKLQEIATNDPVEWVREVASRRIE
jgi:HEAT repeat protein